MSFASVTNSSSSVQPSPISVDQKAVVMKVADLSLVPKGGTTGRALQVHSNEQKMVKMVQQSQTCLTSLSPVLINSTAAPAQGFGSAIQTPAMSIPLYGDYYRMVESGKKNVEGRLRRPLLEKLRSGDILRLTNAASCNEFVDVLITSLTHYPTFKEMLVKE